MAFVGATASGKTALSLDFAELVAAETGVQSEVVPVDTKTTRIGMEIGTAAPTSEERHRVPHHLLDLYYPDELVPRGMYQPLARACMRDIASRDRMPLLVGGSIHLMEALVFFDRHVPMESGPELHKLDDLGLAQLTIEQQLGTPFEAGRQRWRNHLAERLALRRDPKQPPRDGFLLFGIQRYPKDLLQNLKDRTEQMWPALIDEFEALIARCNGFYPEEAKTTIGYGDFHSVVNQGKHPAQSIYDRTLALADWQLAEVRDWMGPHVQWVESAEQAFEKYQSATDSNRRM